MLPIHSLQSTMDMNGNPGTPDLVLKRSVAGGISTGLLLFLAFVVVGILLAAWLIPKRSQPAIEPESPAAVTAAVTQSAAEPQTIVPTPATQDEPAAETKRTTLKPRASSLPQPAANPVTP